MNYSKFKVVELRKMCESRGLIQSGKKSELISLLMENTMNTKNETLDPTITMNMLAIHLESSSKNHKKSILNLSTLKEAHIYCKMYNLKGQFTGPVIEAYIKNKFNMSKNNASDCTGDLQCHNVNYEIKVSNGGKDNNKFNFVQIRMNHNCQYILSVYYICKDNLETLGELFVFKLTKEQMKNLIVNYGGYAHGTTGKNGIITIDSLNEKTNQYEYALRPVYGDNCWNELLQYRIEESQI